MVLFAVAALLGALTLLEIAGFFMTSANAQITAAKAMGETGTEPNDMETHLAQAKSMAEELKKGNLFMPKPPKQHPVKEVIGILGSEALINGKWYKAGDSVGEAKVLAVESTKVKIVWNGQEKEFAPIGATGAGGPGGPRPPRGSSGGKPSPPGGAPMVVTGSMPGGPGGRPNMSDEERARLRERFQNMSPEERQRFRDEMRERSGRRGR